MTSATQIRKQLNSHYLAGLPIIEVVTILDEIEAASDKGETEIVCKSLSSLEKKFFKRLGYSVYSGDYACYISWKKTIWHIIKEFIFLKWNKGPVKYSSKIELDDIEVDNGI